MPNWCENKLRICGNPKRIAEVIKKITDERGALDFNKIVPEPKTIEECPKEFILGEDKKHLTVSKEREWFNWYDWHCEYWGTKWNANTYTSLAKEITNLEKNNSDWSEIIYFFETAWSPAVPIVLALQKQYPDLEFELGYLEMGMWYAGYINEDGIEYECPTNEVEDFAVRYFYYNRNFFHEDSEEVLIN